MDFFNSYASCFMTRFVTMWYMCMTENMTSCAAEENQHNYYWQKYLVWLEVLLMWMGLSFCLDWISYCEKLEKYHRCQHKIKFPFRMRKCHIFSIGVKVREWKRTNAIDLVNGLWLKSLWRSNGKLKTHLPNQSLSMVLLIDLFSHIFDEYFRPSIWEKKYIQTRKKSCCALISNISKCLKSSNLI